VVDYLVVLAVAAICTFLLTYPTRWLMRRLGVTVQPSERRIHTQVIPTIGGAAMLVGFLVATAVASQLHFFHGVFQNSSEPLGVVLAALVIFAVGVVDDVKEVSAPAKAAGQVLAATILYYFGVTMFFFKVPFAGTIVLSPSITPLLTVLWVVGMANAINLIDGLDGLAAGIVAIAAGAFCVYSVHLVDLGVIARDNLGPLVAAIACGVCLGFLPHNFHPAKIIMGDAGALFLGLLMAVSTSVVGGRTATVVNGQTFFFFAPLFIPFLILGVPIIDTAFAIVRRTMKGSLVAAADLDHLHHRLLRLGHGHRRSVFILWAWTALLSGFVLYPTFTHHGNVLFTFAALGLGIALYTLFRPGLRRQPPPVLEQALAVRGVDPSRQPPAAAIRPLELAASGTTGLLPPNGLESRTGLARADDKTVPDGPEGNGPEGNGPEANGPEGNGQAGKGQAGNGQDGSVQEGSGPEGDGPEGNGATEDAARQGASEPGRNGAAAAPTTPTPPSVRPPPARRSLLVRYGRHGAPGRRPLHRRGAAGDD
jgi:UDP-GlcNAc:undecaprenyl-phosphate GlcNAc-1-phosphate transferase